MRDYLAPLVGETEDGTEALLPEEQTILARRWRFSGEGWLEPAEGGPLPEGGAEAPRPEAGQGDLPAAGGAGLRGGNVSAQTHGAPSFRQNLIYYSNFPGVCIETN